MIVIAEIKVSASAISTVNQRSILFERKDSVTTLRAVKIYMSNQHADMCKILNKESVQYTGVSKAGWVKIY